MIGEIKSLHPAFKMTVDRILDAMRARGWDAVIGSGMRTPEQQDALFAQGRESLDKVNALRRKAGGLPPISARENTYHVTKARAGQSNHNLTTWLLKSGKAKFDVMNGYAVDIVSRQRGWLPDGHPFWKDLGMIAKKYGCEWGGDWNPPDRAHVQMKLIDSAPRDSVVV